ncbi:unnamed protein product [Sphagnum balticum]
MAIIMDDIEHERMVAMADNGYGTSEAEFIFDDICNTLSNPPSDCRRYLVEETFTTQDAGGNEVEKGDSGGGARAAGGERGAQEISRYDLSNAEEVGAGV